MCRFLLAHQSVGFSSKQVHHLMEKFAGACERSRTREGDRQEDGWGIAWKNSENQWETYHSLHAIWQDTAFFSKIPSTTTLVVHARSASFAHQKGVLSYNQPYVHNDACFVFNGVLQGVQTPHPIPGKIGAQKIFSILKKNLTAPFPDQALLLTRDFLKKHSRHIVGCNIGLATESGLYALTTESDDDTYFSVFTLHTESKTVICSEAILPHMQPLENEKVAIYPI